MPTSEYHSRIATESTLLAAAFIITYDLIGSTCDIILVLHELVSWILREKGAVQVAISICGKCLW